MENKPGVLVLNPGSATVKWARFESFNSELGSEEGNIPVEKLKSVVLELVQGANCDTFIVRFVHGGSEFIEPTLVTGSMFQGLQAMEELAPIHNHHSLVCIRLLLDAQQQGTVAAVFDTQFFRDLPKVAQLYGLPDSLSSKYRLRRYGFHGFAHQSMMEAWSARFGGARKGRLVTMQLGSGCSMAAILDGRPVDTSMGFTPNEGLLMSTRSGDLDPGLLTWLQRREGWTPDDTDRVLNREAGWFGVSAGNRYMEDLLDNRSEKAQLAVELFCHRVRKTLGAYFALLGGLDGIVMSGGVAEHSPTVRLRLLEELEHLGIVVDRARNADPGEDGLINAKSSAVVCAVVAGREEVAMLRASRGLHSS